MEELKSLVLKVTSLVELLNVSEEISLLDELVGVVVGAEVLSLLGIEVAVPKSLLSNDAELDSFVELEITGLDVGSIPVLVSVDEITSNDDESSGGLRSVEDEAVGCDSSTLLNSILSAPWEEDSDEDRSEGSSEVLENTKSWEVDVNGSGCDSKLLAGPSTCDSWEELVGCALVSSGARVAEPHCSSDVGPAATDSWEVLIGCELVYSGAKVAELHFSSDFRLASTDEVGPPSLLVLL